jgi:hypothetical protein
MSRAKGDVEAQIAAVRALGPAYRRVADLAEVGLVVARAVRQVGLPRERKAKKPVVLPRAVEG